MDIHEMVNEIIGIYFCAVGPVLNGNLYNQRNVCELQFGQLSFSEVEEGSAPF